MRKVLLFFTLILLYGQLLAQSRIISGKVQDEKGNPVPGASIQIKGSRRGTSTTTDGVFSISAPANAKLLLVSSVNFAPQELPISENMIIVLQPAPASGLQEVVVVAYGTQKRSEVTSAISVVDAKAISNQQVTTVGQALQGTAPGVMVVNGNGQPGENPTIRIRGIASIAASAAPLIVLDGIPFDGNLNMINPNDIDNFSVLKDASATALYGSRAANGVILITTKKGKRGLGVTVNGGVTVGEIDKSTFPKYQHEYGANYGAGAYDPTDPANPYPHGYGSPDGNFLYAPVFGSSTPQLVVPTTEDASYGARFDPNLMVYQWDAFVNYPGNANYGKATPWVAAKNGPETFLPRQCPTIPVCISTAAATGSASLAGRPRSPRASTI